MWRIYVYEKWFFSCLDHFYYVGKGCKSFDDAESPPEGVSISRGPHGDETVHGAEEDDGVLVVKSGTDFRTYGLLSPW